MAITCLMLALSNCAGPSRSSGPPSAATPTQVASSNQSATPTATGTSAAAQSPSAGAKPSVVPVGARKHTNAGASEFLRFYMAELNRTWKSPEDDSLASFSTPRCRTCVNFVETAHDLRAHGQRYAADAVTLGPTITLPGSTVSGVVIQAPLRQNRVNILARDGGVVRTTAEVRSLTEATLVWGPPGSWAIGGLRRVDESAKS